MKSDENSFESGILDESQAQTASFISDSVNGDVRNSLSLESSLLWTKTSYSLGLTLMGSLN